MAATDSDRPTPGRRTVLRWGVLGTARTARKRMLPAMLRAGHRIHAIAGRDPARVRQFQAEFNIRQGYPWQEAQDLLNQEEVDAIYIPLPNSMHHEWVARALEAGNHVLSEKPIALSPREVDEILVVADGRPNLLDENFSYHLAPAYRELLRLHRSEEISPIASVDVCHCFVATRDHEVRFDRRLGGGSFHDLGCYGVDLIHRLLDEPLSITTVNASPPSGEPSTWGSGPKLPIDAWCEVKARTPSGVRVRLKTSFEDAPRQTVELTSSNREKLVLPQAFRVEKVESELVRRTPQGEEGRETFAAFDADRELLMDIAERIVRPAAGLEATRLRWRRNADTLAVVAARILEEIGEE